jgi:eukaryotic-like serine/threonine-protein kinase
MPNVMPLRADDHRRVGRYGLTGRVSGPSGPAHGERMYLAAMPGGGSVIVTLLDRERVADAAARDRFAAEAAAARQIAPFCTAQVLDVGIEADEPYLVTEYVPGQTLAEVAGQEGALPDPDLHALAIGTATGLAAIHQAGLVHGSLGPDHVVLGHGGPRVTGFGITAPQGAATPAADMLAWAHTVMFAAVGRPPVGPQDLAALPGLLHTMVAACLTPDPAGRPAARAVLAQLLSQHDVSSGLLAEGTRQARAAARVPPPDPVSRRGEHGAARPRSRVLLWGVACAACLLAIAGGTVYITGSHPGARTGVASTAATSSPGTGGTGQPGPSATLPASVTGKWSGTVHQSGPALTVTVQISLPAGSGPGTIAYPALGCSGSLTVTSVAAGTITLDQHITSGQQNCRNGLITLAPGPAGTLAFTFRRSRGADPAGTLTRQP